MDLPRFLSHLDSVAPAPPPSPFPTYKYKPRAKQRKAHAQSWLHGRGGGGGRAHAPVNLRAPARTRADLWKEMPRLRVSRVSRVQHPAAEQ